MAGGGGEKVEARTAREMEVEPESRKHTERLRFELLPCDPEEQQTTRQTPREMEMEAESRKHMERLMFALLPCCPESFEQCFGQLTTTQRRLVRREQWKLDNAQSLTHIISLLEEHVTHLETQDLPKDMANKLDILDGGGGGDEEEVDMDTSKSDMEGQLPSIDSRLTRLETEAEAEMEGESPLMEQQQSEVLSCGPAVEIHDDDGADGSGDEDKEEVEMGRAKSLYMLTEVEYLKHLRSELEMMEVKYVKQLQSGLRSHLESIKALVGNPERTEEPLRLLSRKILMREAKSFLRQRGYTDARLEISTLISDWMKTREEKIRESTSGKQRSHPFSRTPVSRRSNKGKRRGHAAAHPESMDDTGVSLLLLKEQAKMEGESSSSGEQQVPRIQDSELKSEPTVDDPFLGFLLDMPFASADDDDNKGDIINRGKSAEQIANKGDIINRGKSAEQIANEKEMASEEKKFASYRGCWENSWEPTYGFFTDITAVSPMHFTHSTPGRGLEDDAACFASTLQIFTLRLAEIKGGLEWPLSVYGVVAARDDADHNRNLLFSCDRRESQKLDQDDPFLRLIGPSRAILFTDHVKFEVQLRVKGTTVSQDRAFISAFYHYTRGYYPGVSTICFENSFCTTELCMERIEQTVQATVLSVRVKNGPWPFEYGGEVACFSPSYNTAPSSMNVVLLASRGTPIPKGSDGYLHLTRNVVSVEVKGSLTFFIHAYSQSGEIAAQGQVCFKPKDCNISKKTCFFGDPKVAVEIIVAWSALVSDKRLIAGEGGMFEVFKDQGWMNEDSRRMERKLTVLD